jgi:type I restriction-modification system DNA methylase subunit
MSLLSKRQHNITKPGFSRNDVFYTPMALAKTAIAMVGDEHKCDKWLDPCKGKGAFYDQFLNTCSKQFCEITDGVDFFECTASVDVVISNPPYSLIDKWLEHTLKLKPNLINYLIGINNLTARRIELMERAGYILTKLHMCKVRQWFGMSVIVQWERTGKACVTYDRVVW